MKITSKPGTSEVKNFDRIEIVNSGMRNLQIPVIRLFVQWTISVTNIGQAVLGRQISDMPKQVSISQQNSYN